MSELSSRVELRPLTLSDEDEFCSLARAGAELHLPWTHLPSTPEEFRARMRRFDGGADPGFLSLAPGGVSRTAPRRIAREYKLFFLQLARP
ncbi:hypothetical protein ACWC3X_02575 [Streptomyces populi]